MKVFLVLQNGLVYEGENFGATGTRVGEVVFNTGMVGYEETLTDPSYYGQIITQTYPLIGNYGITGEDAESDHIWAFGYIVRELCDTPSNFRCTKTLDAFLKEENIIGMAGVDTRSLARLLRDSGVMNGAITTEYETAEAVLADETLMEQIRSYVVTDAIKNTTCKAPKTFGEGGKYKVALMDYGYKRNILHSLVGRNCEVTVFPAETSPETLAAGGFDGIMLSNGPGDPAENTVVIENLRRIATLGIPTFGICIGHQLMALAQGATSRKMKYGHRGVNQPVTDKAMGRTHITCQNHGYAIVGESLPAEIGTVSHYNANDNSVEGIRYNKMSCVTVQYHPEACGGPQDAGYLFDEFIAMMQTKED